MVARCKPNNMYIRNKQNLKTREKVELEYLCLCEADVTQRRMPDFVQEPVTFVLGQRIFTVMKEIGTF